MNKAYILIESEQGMAEEVAKQLDRVKGIAPQSTYLITGPFDVITLLEGPDVNGICRTVCSEIQKIKGVKRTQTAFAIPVQVLAKV